MFCEYEEKCPYVPDIEVSSCSCANKSTPSLLRSNLNIGASAHDAHLVFDLKRVNMSSSKQCPYCGRVFSRSFNLGRHLENGSCKMRTGIEHDNINSFEEEGYSNAESFEDVNSLKSNSDSEESFENEYDSDSDESEDMDKPELSWCWQVVVDEAVNQHEDQRQEIIENLIVNGRTEEDARQIANKKVLPAVRKELRNILIERLRWIHLMRRDPFFKKIMKTRDEMLETGHYDWSEALKLTINHRKYLLNDLLNEYLPNSYKELDSNSDDDME